MEISNSKILVIGGAGLIGSHIVEELVQEDVGRLVIFDNFTRGKLENIEHVLQDERVEYYEGDITHVDVLDHVVRGGDYVFHLAALWLLHCHEFPRASFEVNIAGTFNVLEACVKNNVKNVLRYISNA